MKENLGFLTIAQNNNTNNYLNNAYLQALNFKIIHPEIPYAIIIDNDTKKLITEKMTKVFDYVIDLPVDYANNHEIKFANECQVFRLSPFTETIKVESDLLITRSIKHWIYAARLKDVLLSYNCKNYRQNVVVDTVYRDFFLKNNLPNIYNGFMYFRYSRSAAEFFTLAEKILFNWEKISENFIFNYETTPSTDVLYSVTSLIYGLENCTIPTLDYFNFVHMKNGINGWGRNETGWKDDIHFEIDEKMIRVNHMNQYHPFHYYDKTFCTSELITHYEQQYFR